MLTLVNDGLGEFGIKYGLLELERCGALGIKLVDGGVDGVEPVEEPARGNGAYILSRL